MSIETFATHHIDKKHILCSMGDNKGFARIHRDDSEWADSIGKQLIENLTSISQFSLILTNQRDRDGFRKISATLPHLYPHIFTLAIPYRDVICRLFRKSFLIPLGSFQTSTVIKCTKDGVIVQMHGGILGVLRASSMTESIQYSIGDALTVQVIDINDENIAIVNHNQGNNFNEDLSVGLKVNGTAIYIADSYICIRFIYNSCSYIGYLVVTETTHCIKYNEELSCSVSIYKKVQHELLAIELCMLSLSSNNNVQIDTCEKYIPKFPWRIAKPVSPTELDNAALPVKDERFKRRRMEEEIDQFEQNYSKRNNSTPDNEEDFNRQLLGNPNSSFLWIQFIAYHLGLNQVEKARQTAEKALKTIGVRESQELFNIWTAYLNIESLHGTVESFNSIFKRGLSYMDKPEKLYFASADLLEREGRTQRLIEHCQVMTSKFALNKEVWVRLGKVLAKYNKKDLLRRMVRQMTHSLPSKLQCETMQSIAIAEYKYDHITSARTMFEGLVAKAPKRTDFWQTYLDQEISLVNHQNKHGSMTNVRELFERISTLPLPSRVIQQHYTQWLNFEKSHNNEDKIEDIKERARQYVASKISSMETDR